MEFFIVIGMVIVGVLMGWIAQILDRDKTSDAAKEKARLKREAWLTEFARLEKEIKDAEIAYNNARRSITKSDDDKGTK